MKLVTFNIRLDRGWDGANNFDFRKPLILSKIREEQPDIICFQEVLPHVALWLKESLRGYYILGCPREHDLTDEQTCIAYRSECFDVLRMDSYWLSPSPHTPGSRYEVQSICPRICTELTLLDLKSRKVFRLTNTHLDHEGAPARLLAAQQILAREKKETFFPNIPAILTGDMNAEPDSQEIQLFCSRYKNLTADLGHTFHGFGSYQPCQIDYIFTSPEFSCSHAEKWTDNENGVWLSDHYPLCCELSLA